LDDRSTVGDRIGDFLDMEFVGGCVLLIRRVAVDKMVKACPHPIDTTSFARAPRTDALGFKQPLRRFDRMPLESGPPLSRDIGGKVVWGDRARGNAHGTLDVSQVASRSPSAVVADSVSD
jgi:hypothetical protein